MTKKCQKGVDFVQIIRYNNPCKLASETSTIDKKTSSLQRREYIWLLYLHHQAALHVEKRERG